MNEGQKRAVSIAARVLALVAVAVVFVLINVYIDERQLMKLTPTGDSWNICYQVDSVTVESGKLIIDGWFFQLESRQNVPAEIDHTTEFAVRLAEIDRETGEFVTDGDTIYGILTDVTPVVREDVGEYFACEYDYSQCGFTAVAKCSDLDLEHGLYQVLFKTDASAAPAIKANAYIDCGELKFVNPLTQSSLDVAGTDLEEIVTNGICIASRPDYHCDVYQYGWQLYWIVDEEFDFKEGGTYMQYQLATTQFDRLPNYRTDNGWYWSNIGGQFESFEITDTMDCGRYRVSRRDIPNGFSISAFEVGYYEDGQWIWQCNPVRPYYDFDAIPDPAVYGYLGDSVADWITQDTQ